VSELKAQMEAKFDIYCFVCADDLMKPHDSVWVVRRCCDEHNDPVHWCFDNPEELNNRHLPSGHGS
jgi:hypothetical protein